MLAASRPFRRSGRLTCQAVPHDPLSWLAEREAERVAAGLRRVLRPRAAVESVIDLASNADFRVGDSAQPRRPERMPAVMAAGR